MTSGAVAGARAAQPPMQISPTLKRHSPFFSAKPPFVGPDDYHRFSAAGVAAAAAYEAIVVKAPGKGLMADPTKPAASSAAAGDRGDRRFSKSDFFPERSFRSWSAYTSAVSATATGPRLRDRLFHRSTDDDELNALRLRSEHDMKRCLTWWDLIWIGFGSVVGTGIFVLTGQEARESAGPAIVLSYAVAGLSALLSVFCYTEFAVEIPAVGGSFSYLHVELGEFVAFIASANILLEAIVGAAGLARSWTSYFATLINRDPDSLGIHAHGLAEGFNLLVPLASVVLITCTSTLIWITSILSVAVIAFIIAAGSAHTDSASLTPFFPMGAKGVFEAVAVVYRAYTGFDMIATLAEETKTPSRDIPIGLVGSRSAITVVYCLMSLILVMMQEYSDLDPNAAYSVPFASVGMRWAKYLVALGALKGMTTGRLVGALGQARYLLILDRTNWRTNMLTSLLVPYIFLSLPSVLFSVLRGEAGKWIAFIAVVLRLFCPRHFPDWLEMPGSLILLLVAAPDFFAHTIRGGPMGVVVCLAIGCYLLQEHIRASGGFRNSFTQSHGISNTLGIILLLAYPIWRMVIHFI